MIDCYFVGTFSLAGCKLCNEPDPNANVPRATFDEGITTRQRADNAPTETTRHTSWHIQDFL